jgi:hypothetical protein
VTAAEVEALVAHLEAHLPRFGLRFKDASGLQRLIAAVVRPFNRRYLQDYTTVMFGKVWFPDRAWYDRQHPEDLYALLRHEAVHLADAARFPLLFQLSYLFVLPAGVTMRAVWEYRGYAEDLRVKMALDGDVSDAWIEWVIGQFTGSDYLYMWVFPSMLRRRFRALRASLRG